MSYGLLQPEDIAVLEASLAALLPKPVVRVLEIGTYKGDTARGMKDFLAIRGSQIEYWGIETGMLKEQCSPFDGAHMLFARSDESFHLVPDNLDLVFVDGNHCRNAVILDILNYYRKVAYNGFMVFHDTGPAMQGILIGNHSGYCVPGCPDIPEFYVDVLGAWELIGWPWEPWKQFASGFRPDGLFGATSFRNGP